MTARKEPSYECDYLIVEARRLQGCLNEALSRLAELGVDCLEVGERGCQGGYISTGRRVALILQFLAVK